MLSQERQKCIRDILSKNGAVTTTLLTEKFGVSVETIRRDLIALESAGLLKKVHGGAVRVGDTPRQRTLFERIENNEHAKKQIAKTAANLIQNGDTIGIDSGSTTACLADELIQKFDTLTVITHSLDVFEIMHGHNNIRVILCGGDFCEEEHAFCGHLTEQMLNNLYISKLFLSPTAVSLRFGICEWNSDLCMIQKKLSERADAVYYLADSSKFETKALIKIDDVSENSPIITDTGLSDEIRRLYTQNGVKIITQ